MTEVPGNPGMSVTNASSFLPMEVAETLAIDERTLDVFIVWPRRKHPKQASEAADYSLAPGPSNPEWRRTSRRAIEALVGPLPELPPHDALFDAVLARGGRSHEWDRPIFEAVPVTGLPPFHAAYQCAHRARFESMISGSKRRTIEESLAAGRCFIASLTAADRKACGYHQGNWAAVADASAAIVASVDGRDPAAYLAAAEAVRLPNRDKIWLLSLFYDPIVLSTDGEGYTNGQHRGCALRFSGAERAAVVVDFEAIVDDFADWTYLGDG
ncbi:MAG: hypothetical protein M3077_08295 [Candidatus Dormibacteraeota bacterium]|nr:hypothetical protein [Candidatus Dormibacteraeota bacterium]